MALFVFTGAWSANGTLSGNGTAGNPFKIADKADWETFAKNINAGTNASSYYQLTEDIGLTEPVTVIVGDADANPFRGNFDGKGHKLNVDITSTALYAAPFQYVNGATIQNLRVTGSVTGRQYSSGLVGNMTNSTVENCRVTTSITVSADRYLGGIVGWGNGTNYITGCLFDGAGTGNDSNGRMGTLMGYADATTTQHIVNCVEKGTYSKLSGNALAWGDGKYNLYSAIDNIYQISPQSLVPTSISYVIAYDKLLAHTITGSPNVMLTNTGTATTYDVSGLTFYKNGTSATGFIYDGVLYAANTQQVQLQFAPINPADGNLLTSLTASAGTITLANPTTLTMPNSDVVLTATFENNTIQGSGTELDPYLISSKADLTQLAHFVNGGNNYSGCYFRQTKDIGVNDGAFTEMIGNPTTRFAGNYDGNGKRLNVNISGTGDNVAPFRNIEGATIKNLWVTGSVSGMFSCAGLVGHTAGSTVQNCRVSTAIDANSADRAGGIIGQTQSNTENSLTGCCFDGSVSNCSAVGSLIGYSVRAPWQALTDCVENGTYTNCNSISLAYRYGGSSHSVYNCYQVTPKTGNRSYGEDERRAYSIYATKYVTISNTGTPTAYDVSGITCYKVGSRATGFLLKNSLYASNGQDVGLNITNNAPSEITLAAGDYEVTAGSLTSSAPFTNPYTLKMPASEVCIGFMSTAAAYAIWCDGNRTLYFDYNFRDWAVGGIYEGQTITAVSNISEIDGYHLGDKVKTATTVVFKSNFENFRPKSTYGWFRGFNSLTSILGLEYLHTEEVQSMSYMFDGCSGLTSLDVSHFNTANVTNMAGMFDGCSGLTSLDVSHFNTANVTDMSCMFLGCSGLTSLDVSNFNTANVTNMGSMFSSCSGLTSLDVSNFNTANVKYMYSMFIVCSGLTSLDVSNFNTANVTDMSGMFGGCSGLTSLDVSNFNTANVTRMDWMFDGCSGLTSLDVSNFNTANVTNMSSMFSGCWALTSLDVSHFNTAKVTNMHHMFDGCSGLASLDVSHFNTAKVTNMHHMFYGCSGLTSLDVSNFNTANVTDMGGMFSGCSGLTSLDVSNFNTANVTRMDWMFNGCSGLKTIYCNKDWKSKKVEDSSEMFNRCTSLVGAISYDESKVDYNYANPTTGYFTPKPFTPGDANGDGKVTITDAVAVVNYILGNTSTGFDAAAADVNGDGNVTITDAVGIVNIILNKTGEE